MTERDERYLIIPDLQIPFENSRALSFCRYLKRHYKIPDENILCAGDETDQYFGGLWKKNPNATHSPTSEIAESIRKLREWYKAFPHCRVAISNHGTRWWRKAVDAEIPNELLRSYREIIQAPDGWKWKKHWRINTAKPFILEHGDDWGGMFPHKNAAIHNGISTVIGHHHSIAGISHVKTNGLDVWGMTVGSLIDFDSYAFEYARSAKFKPIMGAGVVLDRGRMPVYIPLTD